jgi:hypothetical protein
VVVFSLPTLVSENDNDAARARNASGYASEPPRHHGQKRTRDISKADTVIRDSGLRRIRDICGDGGESGVIYKTRYLI